MTDEGESLLQRLLGSVVPGPAGVAIEHLSGRAAAEIRRARSHALRVASELSGLTREELAARIEQDPQLVAMGVRFLYECGMNAHEEILGLLASAYGSALHNPDHADELELIQMGIERLRPQHIRVLEVLEKPTPEDLTKTPLEGENVWSDGSIAEALTWSDGQAYAAATGLINAGFARAETVWQGALGVRLTPLGEALLDVLRTYRSSAL